MRTLLALCVSMMLLTACGPAPSGPSPSGNPSASPSGSGNSGNASASGSVTASRQAYGNYLNCLQAAHPDSGAGVIANVVLNVYTDAQWATFKVAADAQVAAFTRTYGKTCGA